MTGSFPGWSLVTPLAFYLLLHINDKAFRRLITADEFKRAASGQLHHWFRAGIYVSGPETKSRSKPAPVSGLKPRKGGANESSRGRSGDSGFAVGGIFDQSSKASVLLCGGALYPRNGSLGKDDHLDGAKGREA